MLIAAHQGNTPQFQAERMGKEASRVFPTQASLESSLSNLHRWQKCWRLKRMYLTQFLCFYISPWKSDLLMLFDVSWETFFSKIHFLILLSFRDTHIKIFTSANIYTKMALLLRHTYTLPKVQALETKSDSAGEKLSRWTLCGIFLSSMVAFPHLQLYLIFGNS